MSYWNYFVKGVNYITALLLIITGIVKYIAFGAVSLSASIFIPAFLILFGILLICSELKVKFIVEYMKFLNNYMGRGIFNIYLAALITDDSLGDLPKIFCYIISLCLVVVGVFYMIMFCVKGKDKSEMDEALVDSSKY